MPANDAAVDPWWHLVSPLLDEALELPFDQREAWLKQLRTRDQVLADRVAELLAQHEQLSHAQFLDIEPMLAALAGAPASKRVGAYALTELLGKGGMGTVWLARRADGHFEGQAAVKLLDAARLRRSVDAGFVREGNVLAQLQHPHIAHLIDAGATPEGQMFLVLEYVDGVRIDQYCEQHKLEINARIRLFLDVLAAVAHAHSRLVVHCDLKPANILVTRQGDVKLLDFGIATLLAPSVASPSFQQQDQVAGAMTPQYAAPEQLRGEAVSTATDVYGLGMVLFVLLVGRHPRVDTMTPSTPSRSNADASLAFPPPSVLALQPSSRRVLRGDLDAIVAKALAQNADARYGSVDAFAADLRRFLAMQPVSVHVDTLTYRASKFVRRNRGSVMSAMFTALALIATTTFAVQQMLEARHQRDMALEQTARAEGFSDVITSLLSQGGPQGQPLSAEALLDRAVIEMQHKYKDDPQTLVHMLIRIAGRYYDLRKTSKEYAVELQAEAIARRTHDAALLLDVQCNTVETEVILGRLDLATRRMREAEQLLAQQPDTAPPVRADCLRNAAEVALAGGDRNRALSALEDGIQLLRAVGHTTGNRYSGLLSMRASLNSDLVEAHGQWLALLRLHQQFGRADSAAGKVTLEAIAHSNLFLGRVRQAKAILEADAPELAAMQQDRWRSASQLWTYGEILLRTNDLSRATPVFRWVIDVTKRSGNQRMVLRGMAGLGLALLQEGDVVTAQAQLREIDSIASTASLSDLWFNLSRAQLAVNIALLRGDFADGEREVTAALKRLDNISEPHNSFVAPLLMLRSKLQLAQRHSAEALATAQDALRRFSLNTLDARESADVGEAQLLIAQAQAAVGEGHSAASARAALGPLRKNYDESHPLLRAAVALATQ